METISKFFILSLHIVSLILIQNPTVLYRNYTFLINEQTLKFWFYNFTWLYYYMLLFFYLYVCLQSYSRNIYLYVIFNRLVVIAWKAVFRRILRFPISSTQYQKYLLQRKNWGVQHVHFENRKFFICLYSPTPCAVSGPGNK